MLMAVILCCTAHPDDESMRLGPCLALASDLGHRVIVASATRGEEGSTGNPPLCDKAEVGEVRMDELIAACRHLGASARWLGFRDQELSTLAPGVLAETYARQLRRFRPDAVLTFPAGGISGHLDHLAVCRGVLQAYADTYNIALSPQATGLDAPVRPEPGIRLGPPLPALYFDVLTPERAARERRPAPAASDARYNITIKAEGGVERAWAALREHRTQRLWVEHVLGDFGPDARADLASVHLWRVDQGSGRPGIEDWLAVDG